MVDIATVSVISSAALAGLTIAAGVFGGERQRTHEADLDFEKRVWDRKSEALFTVIEKCRMLIASDDPVTDDNREAYALNLSKTLDSLHNVRSTVEAFASSQCRAQLALLIEALEESGVKHDLGRRADYWLKMSMEVQGIENFEQKRRYSDRQKEVQREAAADLDLDLPRLRTVAQALLEAARESVRRPRD